MLYAETAYFGRAELVKKLIAALVILGVIAGASIGEVLFLKNTFDTVIEKLEKVDDAVSDDIEHVNNPTAMQAMAEVTEYWDGKRMLAMGLINHTQVKNIDDRFAMIARQLEVNAAMDAAITVRTTIRLFEDLYYDAYPSFANLL